MDITPIVTRVPGLTSSHSQSAIKPIFQIKQPSRITQFSSISPIPQKDLKRFASVTKKITVDRLLAKIDPIGKNENTMEKSQVLQEKSVKWVNLKGKNSDALNKIGMQKFKVLAKILESSCQECVGSNFAETVKIMFFYTLLGIFKAFHETCEEVLRYKQDSDLQVNYLLEENKRLYEEVMKQVGSKKPSQGTSFSKPLGKRKSLEHSKSEMEKLKLLEKVSILEEYLIEVQKKIGPDNISELENLKKKSEASTKKIQKLKQQNRQITYRSQLEIGELKAKLVENQSYVNNFSIQSENSKSEIKLLEITNSKLQEKLDLNKEQLQMIGEDYIGMLIYKEMYRETSEKLRILRLRYNQLELEVLSGHTPNQSKQDSWVSSSDSVFTKFQIGFDPNSLQLSISEFKLSAPTYAGLLDLTQENFIWEAEFPNWLELTIRGIYDSKYYEHLSYTSSNKTPSRFPEFVYSWIGKFCISSTTREVTEIEWWKKEDIESLRIKLLLALKQANTSKVWELHTFQEFLNENLMIDELGFFLHCRFLMFQGPQLAHPEGKYFSTHYVKREHVNRLIDNLMPKLAAKEKTDLKTQLHIKSKGPSNSDDIESGFVILN